MREIVSLFINENGSYTLWGKIFFSFLIVIVAKIIMVAINRIFNQKMINKLPPVTNKAKANTIINIIRNVVRFLVYFIATTIILDNFGINTSSLLAAAGIGGIAIAFAAQSIVKDVINGAFILLENQFDINDLVTITSSTGTVIDMGLRITKLKDVNGNLHIIPNGNIDRVINHSRNPMRALVNINISTEVDYERLEESLNQVFSRARNNKDYFIEKPEILGVDYFNEFSYSLAIAAYTENGKQWEAERYLRLEILKELKENNIKISNLEVGNEKV